MKKREHDAIVRPLAKTAQLRADSLVEVREKLKYLGDKYFRLLTIVGDAIASGTIDAPDDWQELNHVAS
jgi:hypothetical protein